MENELSHRVDALPGLVRTALHDGCIDVLHRRWCAYTGLGVDEADGRGWQVALHTTKHGGMAIARAVRRSIIERHAGRRCAAPNDGAGTTFAFSIPHRTRGVARAHAPGPTRVRAAVDAAHAVGVP